MVRKVIFNAVPRVTAPGATTVWLYRVGTTDFCLGVSNLSTRVSAHFPGRLLVPRLALILVRVTWFRVMYFKGVPLDPTTVATELNKYDNDPHPV